jgi:hypothetical protein
MRGVEIVGRNIVKGVGRQGVVDLVVMWTPEIETRLEESSVASRGGTIRSRQNPWKDLWNVIRMANWVSRGGFAPEFEADHPSR